MKLSIIIPHYNSAKQLSRLLDSILSECDDTEIIVVDDCSDKDLDELINVERKYSEKVSFYKNDSGVKGAGAARNIGIEKAGGEWYLFADSDDYFVKGWFSTVRDYFESEKELIYFSPISMVNDTMEAGHRHKMYENYVREYLESPTHDKELYIRYLFVVPWSKMIRASLVRTNNISFDEIMFSNDVMFSVKAGYYAKDIEVCDKVIYCVTEQNGTLTKNTSEAAWHTRHKVFCEKIQFLRKNLPRKDQKFAKGGALSFIRLIEAKNNGYGMRNCLKYLREYHCYNVPVVYSFFEFLKYQIVKRLRKH